MRPLYIALALLGLACGGQASPDGPLDDSTSGALGAASPVAPDNFVKVRDGLYRGAHPNAKNLDYLRSIGVHRILDLEVDDLVEAQPGDILLEETESLWKGIKLVREPMSAFEPAIRDEFDHRMDRVVALLKTATPTDPIYVHCKHGQDRTGLVIGLERVYVEGWTPAAAFNEMRERGFHTFFLGLDEYFERKTGYSPD
ncbi:MAG: tyrosine-protein phosphatase [Polyangiaceae bacterium]